MDNNSVNTKNLLRLIRFLSRKDESGYIFAYTNKVSLIRYINDEIVRTFKNNDESIQLLYLEADSDKKIMEIIENSILKNKHKAIIITNLYEYITGKNGKRNLTEINFSREKLYSLGLPILFWITEETFPLISNFAADLYSQRRLPSLIFEDIIYSIPIEQTITNQFEINNEPNNILRLKIVEDQFNDAILQNIGKQRLISNYLLPYLLELSKAYKKNKVLSFIKKYIKEINEHNFYHINSLATIYYNIYEYTEALKYLSLCINFENTIPKEKLASLYGIKADVYFEMGNLNEALKLFNIYHEIFKDLFHSDPLNMFYKNMLAVSYNKLGIIHSGEGELIAAVDLYNKSFVLMKELNNDYPEIVKYKSDLALIYSKLGSTHSSLGEFDKALQCLENSKTLVVELFKIHYQNNFYKNLLAYLNSIIGSVYVQLGNNIKALSTFKDAKIIMDELFDNDPLNADYKNGLAVLYEKLGEAYFFNDDLLQALDYFKKQYKLNLELFETYPQKDDFKNGLAIACQKLAETYYISGDSVKALEFQEKRYNLSLELYQTHPENISYKNSLATAYFNLGKMIKKSNHDSREHFENALKLWNQLNTDFPDNKLFKKNLENTIIMMENR